MKIKQAELSDVSEIARLFDLYRQFYECPADLARATDFIQQRLENQESTIFLALSDEQQGIGFVQLYSSFCSVDAVRIEILYDLYVDESARKQGVGRKLMNRATEFAKANGAARLDLLTAKDNYAGQALYESLGYEKTNEGFYAYSLVVE